ncbi:hypothetical protein C8F04DRAFT_1102106 [Mycena alexandri]|uniref:Uncharacterized protein n=1 Tax=Mycena alexandri TaxID=1745969 RepID=A0AAD6SWZ3_9AGAR|nr:hypothetical protein C8F04DRAFT_1102106 [Mycena alexandri]
MFSTKSLLATISTATVFIGAANAFSGTAHLGFYNATSCGCGPQNGPFAIAIPSALVGSNVCCNVQINLSFEGESTTAVFSGAYDAGGAQDIALSPDAFAALAGFPEDVSLSPVTWSFF